MNFSPTILTFTTDIEQRIIERIRDARNSVYIAMAWFTSKPIKAALINLKVRNPAVEIGIVVDNNEVNKIHFHNSACEFADIGIAVFPKISRKFLHQKFMVIDEMVSIVGSYNYTNKAKSNLEHINVLADAKTASFYIRIFRVLTDVSYQDQNIRILFDHPDFAQKILAAYYPFSKKEFLKYERKIPLGFCHTFCTGDWDDIDYEAGFIFNPKHGLDKRLKSFEFPLPVSKSTIKNWVGNRNDLMILENYRGHVEYYDEISPAMERNWEEIDEEFKRIVEDTYRYSDLNELVKSGIDVIKEDTLWQYNFALFLNKDIICTLYDLMSEVEKYYWWEDFSEDFNHNAGYVIIDQ